MSLVEKFLRVLNEGLTALQCRPFADVLKADKDFLVAVAEHFRQNDTNILLCMSPRVYALQDMKPFVESIRAALLSEPQTLPWIDVGGHQCFALKAKPKEVGNVLNLLKGFRHCHDIAVLHSYDEAKRVFSITEYPNNDLKPQCARVQITSVPTAALVDHYSL